MIMELTPKPPEAAVQSPAPCSQVRPYSSDHAPILSFTNGALKRHPPPRTLYRECLRNHAATLGRHALDGCGEFMPSPLSSPSDPTSLKCAACGCHRNFHRREDDDAAAAEFIVIPTKRRNSHSPPPPPLASSSPYYTSAPQMLMALSAGLSGPDADNIPTTPNTTNLSSTGRKRFRTKFSKEQKESMYSFSEKLGWKMQKEDEKAVEDFCNEIGVGKGVLKVWMHNNKHTFLKRDMDRERDGLIMAVNRNIGTSSNIDTATVNHHNISSSPHLMNGSSSSS